MKSNFCVLMDLLGISPKSLSITIGADLTLISKWRTGSRKLINGRHWATDIANYMIEKDYKENSNIIKTILSVFYPTQNLHNLNAASELLRRWLTTQNQFSKSYQANRSVLLEEAFSISLKTREKNCKKKKAERKIAATGISQIKDAFLELLDHALESGPSHIKVVCVDGLSIFSHDEEYLDKILNRLFKMFIKGYKLTFILRTDFKISEVAFISGHWLKAHLLGYIESYYYDDFTKSQDISMLVVYPGKISIIVLPDEKHNFRCEIVFRKNLTDKLEQTLLQYQNLSVKRFHYNLFKNPIDFLYLNNLSVSNSSFFFSNLPHLTIRAHETPTEIGITENETSYLLKKYHPLMNDIKTLLNNDQVYCIFCVESIDDALEHSRKLVHEYTEILGRRIYMSTSVFIRQLIQLKELNQNPNFNLCFLSQIQFEKIGLSILISGLSSAIAWIPGLNSAACKDFTSVGALSGFCSTIYKNVPDNLKSKSFTNQKLTDWLKRAKLFGYDVK